MTTVNIVLLGESGVGKTTILYRFLEGKFKERFSTTFVDCYKRKIIIEDKEITLCLWDTNGQERYAPIMRNYYRNVDGVLLVYDVTDIATFYRLSNWLCNVKGINETAEIVIAGNKNEDPEKRNVTVSMVKNFARDENADTMEMSAKSGENVEKAFQYLAERVLVAKKILTPKSSDNPSYPESEVLEEPTRKYSEEKDSIKLHEQPKKKESSCFC